MIAPLRTSALENQSCLHQRFLTLLPQIRQQAQVAWRGLRPDAREELTQEVVANAFCAFAVLVRQGKEALAYATPLAQFAIRQVRAGRRVGCRQNVQDLMSPCARRIQGFTIERLDQQDAQSGAWSQLLVADHRAGPAETAAARIDLAAWSSRLSKRNRRIARALALGESTGAVARQFGLSPARVSQLRGWFRRHWEQFQGSGRSAGCAAS